MEKNLVVITSVINCVNTPLSYYHIRSIFNTESRYEQTLISINSLKKIPNVEIMLCECSELPLHYEEQLKGKVNYYFNFYNDENIRCHVTGPLKGMGETHIMLKAIEKIDELNLSFKNMFKLSGRYFLNENFNFQQFNNDKNIFSIWDNSPIAYCTIFYKINNTDLALFKSALSNSINDLLLRASIELCIYNYFKSNIELVSKLNVSGKISTEGYFFTI